MMVMMGAAGNIGATVASPKDQPWLFKLVPTLERAKRLHTGALDVEALVHAGIKVAILPKADRAQQAQLAMAGIKASVLGFDDFDGLQKCVWRTATLVGTTLARQRAQAYQQALQASLKRPMPPAGAGQRKPRLLHIASLRPLRVDGCGTILAQWTQAAGATTAAQGVCGNRQSVTPEQVLAWAPDIIILAANAGPEEWLAQDPVLSRLAAVRHGHVWRNPAGLFLWDRYGPELLLQLSWARMVVEAETHPIPGEAREAAHEKVAQAMMVETRAFYSRFYGIALSKGEAWRIVHAQPPQP
ncbi:ABC transporter substrate-binding protein [Formicincola oecophyllae]|uniref:ABC transporter substrate-binding protein n=2 Tax=Formicincola oecophyllae TaxID=2558361 RepID=A0A4Y6UB90_9PROT|nr:ABC transporter substrate-binding protein [Formicincola oecophyllae]